MTAPQLPVPKWASDVLRRLDELPSILRQQETIGRLLTVIRALTDEKDALTKALADSRNQLAAAKVEIDELQQVIIKRLTVLP